MCKGYYSTAWRADGRIMIDGVSFQRMNPSYREFNGGRSSQVLILESMWLTCAERHPEEKLFMTWPTIGGFSFAIKKWGEIIVSNIEGSKYTLNLIHLQTLFLMTEHLRSWCFLKRER